MRAPLRASAQQDSPYARRVKGANLVEDVLSGALELLWAKVQAVADAPTKVVAQGEELERALLTGQIREPVANAQADVTIVSPYFVPGREGVEFLVQLRRRGVRVRVLTHSFAATDVSAVHGGYQSYRRDLLVAGVELYELRPTSDTLQAAHAEGLFGSSGASLHAKTFVVDGRDVFVGSLNLDPRSIELNTELGLVVESEELAALLLASIERAIRPDLSWRVRLDGPLDDACLVWEGEEDGALLRWTSEPSLGCWSGLWLGFLRLLPVEGQL